MLVLFDGPIGAAEEQFLRGFLHPLWDLPVIVGHQVRELADFAQLETDNPEFLLALLDARRIVGDPALHSRFLAAFHGADAHAAILAQLQQLIDERHARFNGTLVSARAGHQGRARRAARPARRPDDCPARRSRRCSSMDRPIRRGSTMPRTFCCGCGRSCISSGSATRTS